MYHTDIILQKHLEKLSPSLKKKTIFRIFFFKNQTFVDQNKVLRIYWPRKNINEL